MPTYLIPRDVQRLAAAIEESAMSAAEIATKAGVTRQFLGRLAAGGRQRINARSAALIEHSLGVDRGFLFRLEEEADMTPYLGGPDEDAA